MSSYDLWAASQLLGRKYSGIPFTKAQYEVVADSSSLQQSYANFQLQDNGLGQAIIDVSDEGTEICLIANISSSTSTAYTGSEVVTPKAAGWLGFVDHVEAAFYGNEYQVNDPQGSASYLLGPKVAIEEGADYVASMNASLAYALDTSASLTGSFTPGATGPASYSGIGSSQTVNGGIAVRQALWNQRATFNSTTKAWQVEIHLPLRHLHPLFRNMGCRYGLPITTLKIWYNNLMSVCPVTVVGGPAPKITWAGSGFNTFRYRKFTPTSEFERTLMEHLMSKTETVKFLRPVTLPSVTTGSTALANINLGSVPEAERLWVFIMPSGSQLSSSSLYPYYQDIALNSVMIKVGGEQLYDRQLALQNGLGNYEYSEVFRLLQESMPSDPWTGRPDGQFGLYFWSIANRYHVFPINERVRANASQSLLFQAIIAQDTQAGSAGLAPTTSAPVDVIFIAEVTERFKISYKKLQGLLTPMAERA